MVNGNDPRKVAQEEIAHDMDSANIGRAGSERRIEFITLMQWLEDQKKRQETRKERRAASLAGIGYGMLGTLVTALLTWATGALQWLLSILTSRH